MFDIAFYFGQVFLRNHPEVTWELYKGEKTNIDYNQPVLSGFGKKHLNPIRIVDVATRGMRSGEQSGDRLHELYEVWKKYIVEKVEKSSV